MVSNKLDTLHLFPKTYAKDMFKTRLKTMIIFCLKYFLIPLAYLKL